MTSKEFFEDIDEIITDKVYLTDSLEELNKEIETNHWSIGIDSETAKSIKLDDLRDFLLKVIENRTKQLDKSDKNIDLIFYSWFDEQSGNLNLNCINSKHDNLPFKAELKIVDSIDTIINDFLDSNSLDGFPADELDVNSVDFKDNTDMDFQLNVYKEKIRKARKHNSGE